MPIVVSDQGLKNNVEIGNDVLEAGNGNIILQGDNNRIAVKSPALALGGYFRLIDGANVTIDEGVNGPQMFVHAVAGTELKIGKNVGFNGFVRLLLHEPASLIIGDGCLIASEVDFMTSDMHSIIDCETGLRINPAKNIRVGNHVWIGQRCLILKGADIGDGSIVGAQSLVSKKIPSRCLAAGNPTRLLRTNVTWDQKLL